MLTMAAPKKKRTSAWTPKRLKALRAKLGNITQAEAAKKIGVSTAAWASWEGQGLAARTPSATAARLLQMLSAGKLD